MNHLIKTSHRQGAFTLIELLVVISIIALLIAILLPALKNAREAAMMTVCQSTLRQTAITLQLYRDDTGGYIPPPQDTAGLSWMQQLRPYIRDHRAYEVIHCPSIPLEINGSSTLPYGLNSLINVFNYQLAKEVEKLRSPTQTILVADAIDGTNGSGWVHPYNKQSFVLIPESGIPYTAYLTLGFGKGEDRHLDSTNILFADSHVISGHLPANDNTPAINRIMWQGEMP